jgi:hypothetical protein
MSTYAFKNIVGSFTHPDVGLYAFAGQIGVKQMTITNSVERGMIDVASDGAIMVSYVAGANGTIDIEMQQQSSLHEFLTTWANTVFTLADNGDASNFAAAAILIKDLLTGQSKSLTGVFPVKIPDVPYGHAGATLTWRMLAAEVVSQ